MTETAVLVTAANLESFVRETFVAVGMLSEEAAFCSGCLVESDLRGIESHGVMRLPVYVRRLQSGGVNPRPQLRVVRGDAGFVLMDGDDGLGFVVGRAAMLKAVELARRYGIAAVGVTGSSHFGAAGIYARLAADHDMIGIAMSNVVAKVVAPGGSRPITGNNPLAVAVPTFGEFPFALDMSLSAAAGGKLLLAAKRGERIPGNWATDSAGRPTDDPREAFDGFYLPLGGVKGLGLSFVVDILSGLITGGPFGPEMTSMYSSDEPTRTGHMMIAIDVTAIISRVEFQERMTRFVETVHASPMRDSAETMRVPGERAHLTEVRRREEGVPVPAAVFDELTELAARLGVSARLEPVETTPSG